MPLVDASAQELLDALDHINVVLACITPATLGQLANPRFRVMRSLINYLGRLDERCSALRSSCNERDKVLGRTIIGDVSRLRSLVNVHVSRWSPAAIQGDLPAYKIASGELQRAMREVVNNY